MIRYIFLVLICAGVFINAGASGISVDTMTNYNAWGWKAIVVQNDFIKFAVMPAIGGRVMQYDLGTHSSVYVNPAEYGKTYTPAQFATWHNFGGYKTWPSPQSRWPNTWPPPATLDYGNYSFQIDSLSGDSVSVSVTSPVEQWIATGIQFERKATLYPGTSRVRMDQKIINTGAQPASWGMWSVTQSIVKHTGLTDYENFWAYFPVNPGSVYGPTGASSPDGASTAWKGEVVPGVYGVQFVPDNKKIFGDSHKGWIAYADLRDGVVYVRTFDVFEGAHYPDSARVTVYVSAANPVYMEVEVKGPIVDLAAAGGEYTLTEYWYAANVQAPVLDANSAGVVAGRLSYLQATQTLSGRYGIFNEGTACVALVDSDGQVIAEGASHPVTPMVEFQLQETIAIPDSAKMIEVRVYNSTGDLVGILDTARADQIITAVESKKHPEITGFGTVQNFPNPFNPNTTITYELTEKSDVKISIYNVRGREIKTFSFNDQHAGGHGIVWDGRNNSGTRLSSGTYVYRISAVSSGGGRIFKKSGKMTIIK
jgi:hypothetical protein